MSANAAACCVPAPVNPLHPRPAAPGGAPPGSPGASCDNPLFVQPCGEGGSGGASVYAVPVHWDNGAECVEGLAWYTTSTRALSAVTQFADPSGLDVSGVALAGGMAAGPCPGGCAPVPPVGVVNTWG
jgi:hypothetical protein